MGSPEATISCFFNHGKNQSKCISTDKHGSRKEQIVIAQYLSLLSLAHFATTGIIIHWLLLIQPFIEVELKKAIVECFSDTVGWKLQQIQNPLGTQNQIDQF